MAGVTPGKSCQFNRTPYGPLPTFPVNAFYFRVAATRVHSSLVFPGEDLLRKSLSVTCEKNYSYLNATMGSTRMARRAGIQQAASATEASRTAIDANVSGSVGLTP